MSEILRAKEREGEQAEEGGGVGGNTVIGQCRLYTRTNTACIVRALVYMYISFIREEQAGAQTCDDRETPLIRPSA